MSTFGRHTHFGPDQVFSRHSIYLKSHDAKTVPQLTDALEKSWQSSQGMGRVKVIELSEAADVTGWLSDHVDHRLHHHTTAHQYVFERKVFNGEQRAVLTAKCFSVSDEADWRLVGPVLRASHSNPSRNLGFAN